MLYIPLQQLPTPIPSTPTTDQSLQHNNSHKTVIMKIPHNPVSCFGRIPLNHIIPNLLFGLHQFLPLSLLIQVDTPEQINEDGQKLQCPLWVGGWCSTKLIYNRYGIHVAFSSPCECFCRDSQQHFNCTTSSGPASYCTYERPLILLHYTDTPSNPCCCCCSTSVCYGNPPKLGSITF